MVKSKERQGVQSMILVLLSLDCETDYCVSAWASVRVPEALNRGDEERVR